MTQPNDGDDQVRPIGIYVDEDKSRDYSPIRDCQWTVDDDVNRATQDYRLNLITCSPNDLCGKSESLMIGSPTERKA